MSVAEGDSPPEGGSDRITPRMLFAVLRGTATAKEQDLVRRALRDPASELHDWLQAVEAWAEETFNRKSTSSDAADQQLRLAIMRTHRQDVVSFLHQKRAEGRLTDEEVSRILAAGAISTEPGLPPASADYSQSASAMLQLTLALHPELTTEVEKLSSTRDRGR